MCWDAPHWTDWDDYFQVNAAHKFRACTLFGGLTAVLSNMTKKFINIRASGWLLGDVIPLDWNYTFLKFKTVGSTIRVSPCCVCRGGPPAETKLQFTGTFPLEGRTTCDSLRRRNTDKSVKERLDEESCEAQWASSWCFRWSCFEAQERMCKSKLGRRFFHPACPRPPADVASGGLKVASTRELL